MKELTPEEIFNLATVMPQKRIKVQASLQDEDDDEITIAEVCENLVEYISDELSKTDSTVINSELFPLCAQFVTSLVPRFVGLRTAAILFQSNQFRTALVTLALGSVLFSRYIDQKKLKVVSEVTPISEEELDQWISASNDADQMIDQAFNNIFGKGKSDDNDPE